MLKTNYLFTYIIPFRYKDAQGFNNLKRVIDWVTGFTGVEAIVVEQDTSSKIQNSNIRCRHIFCKSEYPFNMSLAYNVGAKYSVTDKIVFGTARHMMDPDKLLTSLNDMDIFSYDFIKPYREVVDLLQQEVGFQAANWKTINRQPRYESKFSGITIWKKQVVLNMQGWPEDFIGGMEDLAMEKIANRMNVIQQHCEGSSYVLHQSRPEDFFPQLMQRNSQILQDISTMDNNSFNEYLKFSSHKMGYKSRYDVI